MSNAFITIKMCYVYNQWYDISCATLYLQETLFLLKTLQTHFHQKYLSLMKSDFYVSYKKTVLKQYLYSSQKIKQNVDDYDDDNNNSSPELQIYAPGKEAL